MAAPTVTIKYGALATFPLEIILPMSLVDHNRRVRRLLLLGTESTLPKPIADWLLTQRPYANLFTISQA